MSKSKRSAKHPSLHVQEKYRSPVTDGHRTASGFFIQAIENRWTHHASRITALAWAPTGQHIASSSLDSHVFIWSVADPLKTIPIRLAGPGGVNGVAWLSAEADKGSVASAGADGCVRVWEVQLK